MRNIVIDQDSYRISIAVPRNGVGRIESSLVDAVLGEARSEAAEIALRACEALLLAQAAQGIEIETEGGKEALRSTVDWITDTYPVSIKNVSS